MNNLNDQVAADDAQSVSATGFMDNLSTAHDVMFCSEITLQSIIDSTINPKRTKHTVKIIIIFRLKRDPNPSFASASLAA